MPEFKIGEETNTKLMAMSKIVNMILGDQTKRVADYVELVLSIGMERMLRDLLPHDNVVLQDTMVQMFREKPDFVTDFIVRTLKEGMVNQVKDKWQPYYG